MYEGTMYELGSIYSLTQTQKSFWCNGESSWQLSRPWFNPLQSQKNYLIRPELWKNSNISVETHPTADNDLKKGQ